MCATLALRVLRAARRHQGNGQGCSCALLQDTEHGDGLGCAPRLSIHVQRISVSVVAHGCGMLMIMSGARIKFIWGFVVVLFLVVFSDRLCRGLSRVAFLISYRLLCVSMACAQAMTVLSYDS